MIGPDETEWRRHLERHEDDDRRERHIGERVAVVEREQGDVRDRLKLGAQSMDATRQAMEQFKESTREEFEAMKPKPISGWKLLGIIGAPTMALIGLVVWLARLPTNEDMGRAKESIRSIELKQVEQTGELREIKNSQAAQAKQAEATNTKLDTIILALPKER